MHQPRRREYYFSPPRIEADDRRMYDAVLTDHPLHTLALPYASCTEETRTASLTVTYPWPTPFGLTAP